MRSSPPSRREQIRSLDEDPEVRLGRHRPPRLQLPDAPVVLDKPSVLPPEMAANIAAGFVSRLEAIETAVRRAEAPPTLVGQLRSVQQLLSHSGALGLLSDQQIAEKCTKIAAAASLKTAFFSPSAAATRASAEAEALAQNIQELVGADLGAPAALSGRARAALARIANGHPDPAAASRVLLSHPKPEETIERFAQMFTERAPIELESFKAQEATLVRTMSQSKVLGGDDIDRLLTAIYAVRQAFQVGATELDDDMQRTNWVHTRVELENVVHAAETLDLGRVGTLSAVYGSLFSDAFKDGSRHSLLWHNRAGAEFVTPFILGKCLDGDPDREEITNAAIRVAREHQISPPMFMAGPLGSALKEHLGLDPGDEFPDTAEGSAAQEILKAVMNPLDSPQRDGEIEFSRAAEALFAAVGLIGWAVPHESSWKKSSQATIAGDMAQYVSPDGMAKIAVDIRDPESPIGPFMRDSSMRGAVDSSVEFSFGQWESVLGDTELRDFMLGRQADARQLLESDVYPRLDARLRKAFDGEIPYWDVDVPIDEPLSEAQRTAVDFVKTTFREILAEVTGVSFFPFGGDEGSAR